MKQLVGLTLAVLVLASTGSALQWRNSQPAARCTPVMAIDTANRRAILFGGFNSENMLNDLWEMPLDTTNGYRWLPLAVSGKPPSGRARPAMAYDPENQRMIVFGGNDSTGDQRGDFWALDLTPGSERWESLKTTGGNPAGRTLATATYCPTRHSMLFYGGAGGPVGGYYEVWELNLSTLKVTLIPATDSGPGVRCGCGSFFDSDSDRLIIVGGVKNDFYNDVWALSLDPSHAVQHWTQLPIAGPLPHERSGFAFGWIESERRLYVFAGWAWDFYNDLWYLDFARRSWHELSPSGPLPSNRRNPAGAYDPFNGNLLVFGGESYDGYCDDSPFIHVFDVTDAVGWHADPQDRSTVCVPTVGSGPVRVRYAVADQEPITIKIVDGAGRVVQTLYRGYPNGTGTWLTWDRYDARGRKVPAGIYLCVMEKRSGVVSARFNIIR